MKTMSEAVEVTLACKTYPTAPRVHLAKAVQNEGYWAGLNEREILDWWPTEHYHALSASAGGDSKPS